MKTSKKTSKKMNFYFTILDFLKTNSFLSMSDIAIKLNISKQNLHFYTRQLTKLELIEKKGYGTWQLTENARIIMGKPDASDFLLVLVDKIKTSKNKSSLGMTNIINFKKQMEIHAIQIKIPVKSGTINLVNLGGRITKDFRNWTPEYLSFAQPIEITIRNNNNQSISLFITSHKITKLSNIIDIVSSAKSFIYDYFKNQGVELDIWNSQVLNTDIAREDDVAEEKLRKGDKVTQEFNKTRRKITDLDPDQTSKAWIDTSPEPSLETNDLDYMYAYLKMPFRVENMEKRTEQRINSVLGLMETQAQNIALLTEQINAHIPAIVKLGENAEKLGNNTEKMTEVILEILKKNKKQEQEQKKKIYIKEKSQTKLYQYG